MILNDFTVLHTKLKVTESTECGVDECWKGDIEEEVLEGEAVAGDQDRREHRQVVMERQVTHLVGFHTTRIDIQCDDHASLDLNSNSLLNFNHAPLID